MASRANGNVLFLRRWHDQWTFKKAKVFPQKSSLFSLRQQKGKNMAATVYSV
jgi:hypothetical protein